ncbi:primosomal protein N' [candidate division WOR-3 bacterium]|nr:primosomal protein N' [candidate division WOR-3 bacterium]
MRYYNIAVPIDKFINFTYVAKEEMNLNEGSVVSVPFKSRTVLGVVIEEAKAYKGAKEVEEKILDLPINLYELVLWVSNYYLCPLGIVYSFILPPFMKRIKRVEEYQIIGKFLNLSTPQEKSYLRIKKAVEEDFHETFLLFGVTGSGKTEVYLRVMEDVLKKGKSVLYLVPEISIIPQVLERVRGRFGMGEAYHYKLSKGMRYSYWMNTYNGELKIGIGSRMSIFSPFHDLGLIIVDEEHSESYKQEEPKPRFSARDVAVMRGAIERIPVILGSATPSLESYYKAKNGEYIFLELPERVKGQEMPDVEIVDPGRNIFSAEMDKAIKETINKKDMPRVILFLNRRGYAPYGKCYKCGWAARCPNCDISLNFHKATNSLLCHHCGYKMDKVINCPKCGKEVTYLGWGTQRIEEEIKTKYKEYNIQRMDTDSISRRHDHERIYNDLKRGEIQILLGTQMVTKGLDLPDIGLVGVISADTAINLPDFRASERTFQLLSQVAGRAGRGGKGKVIIQSNNPNHYAIRFAKEHNYEGFYDKEREFRLSAKYPPFVNLARILIQSKEEEEVIKVALKIKTKLNESKERELFTILGPVPCPIGWIERNYRYHILLKSEEENLLQMLLKKLYSFRVGGVRISFEIDPVNML